MVFHVHSILKRGSNPQTLIQKAMAQTLLVLCSSFDILSVERLPTVGANVNMLHTAIAQLEHFWLSNFSANLRTDSRIVWVVCFTTNNQAPQQRELKMGGPCLCLDPQNCGFLHGFPLEEIMPHLD